MIVYQVRRGVWRVSIELGMDSRTGKRKRLTRQIEGTKKQAQEEEARLRHERAIGSWVPPHKETVAEYLRHWLRYMRGRVSDSTLAGYKAIVDDRLIEDLGAIRLQELTTMHIAHVEERWLTAGRRARKHTGTPLSSKTVLNFHRCLQRALEDAVRQKRIPTNPADKRHMDPPAYERSSVQSLDIDEAKRLAEVLSQERHGVALYVLLATGMRSGEVLGLQWGDIDYDARLIHIERAYNRVLKRLSRVKTHRSRRPVALDDELESMLRKHHVEQTERRLKAGELWMQTDLVFTDNIGGQLTHDSLRKGLESALRKAGLGHITPHGLRHTHASLLVRLGTHMRLVQERLGHASYAITADTYSHIQAGMDAEAAAQLGRALRGSTG